MTIALRVARDFGDARTATPSVHTSPHSGAELEVRVLVKNAEELLELKRAGAGLLSIAPSSRPADYILFQRGPLKAGGGGGTHTYSHLLFPPLHPRPPMS